MEKLKLCVRWSACRHPVACFKLHASSKKNRPSWLLFSFQMATVLPLRTTWIADFFRKRPCAMYKDNAVGNIMAETARDCGTTARRSDLSMPFPLCASPLKGEVRRSPEPSARSSTAADSEKRQICTTCLFADSVGLWKDGGLMLSPIVEHTSVWEGLRGRGRDLTWQPAANPTTKARASCQSHKQQQLRPRRGPSKGAHTRTKNDQKRT